MQKSTDYIGVRVGVATHHNEAKNERGKRSEYVTIRKAVSADKDALVSLFLEFYLRFNMEQTLVGETKELLEVDDPKQFAVDTITSYFKKQHIMYVAAHEDRIIGYISGVINKVSHHIYSPEAEIIDWFVTERQRGSGIGRQLYDAFVRHVKNAGCQVLSVEAFCENKKTIHTYERLGFSRDSVILKKLIVQ